LLTSSGGENSVKINESSQLGASGYLNAKSHKKRPDNGAFLLSV